MTTRQTAARFAAKMDARLTDEELESFSQDKVPMAELMCTLDQQVSRLRMTVAKGGKDEHIADHLADVAITCLQAFCNIEPGARGDSR